MRQLSREVLCKLQERYSQARKVEKTKILNEIECLSSYHRKHLISVGGTKNWKEMGETG